MRRRTLAAHLAVVLHNWSAAPRLLLVCAFAFLVACWAGLVAGSIAGHILKRAALTDVQIMCGSGYTLEAPDQSKPC